MKKLLLIIVLCLSFILVGCTTKGLNQIYTYEYTCDNSMSRQGSFATTNSIDAFNFVWNEIRETKKNCQLMWMKENGNNIFETRL